MIRWRFALSQPTNIPTTTQSPISAAVSSTYCLSQPKRMMPVNISPEDAGFAKHDNVKSLAMRLEAKWGRSWKRFDSLVGSWPRTPAFPPIGFPHRA
jgi:hypothetical protein